MVEYPCQASQIPFLSYTTATVDRAVVVIQNTYWGENKEIYKPVTLVPQLPGVYELIPCSYRLPFANAVALHYLVFLTDAFKPEWPVPSSTKLSPSLRSTRSSEKMSALTVDSDWPPTSLVNAQTVRLPSSPSHLAFTRFPKACNVSGTMVKRQRNAVEGEGDSPSRTNSSLCDIYMLSISTNLRTYILLNTIQTTHTLTHYVSSTTFVNSFSSSSSSHDSRPGTASDIKLRRGRSTLQTGYIKLVCRVIIWKSNRNECQWFYGQTS
ncbi:hypothetical protein J3R30DRAFT_3681049 [Lentinula aciculospora]|uniref:Uncharacterized protein n=1 Tax=Lentinula aciculospora TaxID=153920 RepID=A0A9W9AKB6_9AGAR|nr:hypothetical protein J3R30DRAFT_3681049 [Lentinula aciculospora]